MSGTFAGVNLTGTHQISRFYGTKAGEAKALPSRGVEPWFSSGCRSVRNTAVKPGRNNTQWGLRPRAHHGHLSNRQVLGRECPRATRPQDPAQDSSALQSLTVHVVASQYVAIRWGFKNNHKQLQDIWKCMPLDDRADFFLESSRVLKRQKGQPKSWSFKNNQVILRHPPGCDPVPRI